MAQNHFLHSLWALAVHLLSMGEQLCSSNYIVLWPHRQYAAVYLDNLMTYLSTCVDHLYHLGVVLRDHWKAGLTTKPIMCHLGMTEAQFLG